MAFQLNLVWIAIPVLVFVPLLPLYIAVKWMGGEVSFWKVLIIKILELPIIIGLVLLIGPLGVLVGFLTIFLIYKFSFGLSFKQTAAVWSLEGTFMGVMIIIAIVLLGIKSVNLGLKP